ncbi:MAR-binding filament-like protein [Rhynchospora pubera]|uniref:MAR-binding filament-like protein n=1 Tax=Rhynchospora pubera TaxID=906938 RepID=A0AAV8FES2_9POAL|nr:MAR-binding filament-like protein [Rhynchospora pubera]
MSSSTPDDLEDSSLRCFASNHWMLKDSMKRTISAMLGLLPSDQFHVSVRVLHHHQLQLPLSSIVTGYTLWNAEYRIGSTQNKNKESEGQATAHVLPGAHHTFNDLSSAAQTFIQNMESDLRTLQKGLDAQNCENLYIQHNRKDSNDLLEYLRSLDPPMIYELSKPSSSEVEGIVHQLVLSIYHKFFLGEDPSVDEADDSGTHISRDHLAKLLFWCMLMGHHLRGLEHRLHLSWVI